MRYVLSQNITVPFIFWYNVNNREDITVILFQLQLHIDEVLLVENGNPGSGKSEKI